MDNDRMQSNGSPPRARDYESVGAVAEGSRRALSDLYVRHHRRLVRFLSRFTSSYESIEEIINDTFMVVWQSAKEFRYESQVSTWILSIAYRKLLMALRAQQSRPDADPSNEHSDHTVDPTALTEVQDWLTRGLSQLPDEQRVTLELAFHMGHTLQEIASITDTSVATVKSRMFQARKKLRYRLPELGGGDAEHAAGEE